MRPRSQSCRDPRASSPRSITAAKVNIVHQRLDQIIIVHAHRRSASSMPVVVLHRARVVLAAPAVFKLVGQSAMSTRKSPDAHGSPGACGARGQSTSKLATRAIHVATPAHIFRAPFFGATKCDLLNNALPTSTHELRISHTRILVRASPEFACARLHASLAGEGGGRSLPFGCAHNTIVS